MKNDLRDQSTVLTIRNHLRKQRACNAMLASTLAAIVSNWSPAELKAAPACGNDVCNQGTCLFDGITNTPLGRAVLKLSNECFLQITGITSTGEDGFAQTGFTTASQASITGFDDHNFADAMGGESMDFKFFGKTTAAGQNIIAVLIALEVPPGGGKVNLSVDYSNVGAQLYNLFILKGGSQVGVATRVPMAAAAFELADIYSVGSSIVPTTTAATSTYGVDIRLRKIVHIALDGGDSADGDEIRIVVSGSTTTALAFHSRVETTIANMNPVGVIFEYGGSVGTGQCVDPDHDGYGTPGDPSCPLGPQTDCNPENAHVNPGAHEVCNHIDDNCNGIVDEGFDLDNDEFTTCGGDCDDTDPDINPRATEVCNGIDDNCDGNIDEGFGPFALVYNLDRTGFISVQIPPGSACSVGTGDCAKVGTVVCAPDGQSASCDAVPGTPGVEGPAGSDSCYDDRDNDCDGLVDFDDPNCQGPEVCDGYDNNHNGQIDEPWANFLGNPCFVGIGMCRNQGVYICKEDPTGVECSAKPYPPGVEGPPGTHTCHDGKDNDCDGLTDCFSPTGGPGGDPDCRAAERCDGLDNDCNGIIDDPWQAVLGQPCSRGIGACKQSGHIVCKADGSGVECNAVPLPGFYEGPGDCSCSDGIDNDCDGLVDQADPNCSSAQLLARCSLDECRPKTGNDCYSGHRIAFDYTGGMPGAQVTAELLALDENAKVLATLPVENGDIARLQSRKTGFGFDAETDVVPLDLNTFQDWDVCKTGPDNPTYLSKCEIFDDDCDHDIDLKDAAAYQNHFGETRRVDVVVAPIPLLRVTVDDGQSKSVAFCSNTPYLDVVKPDHTVVSESEGDITNIVAAIPLVDPRTLSLKIDGFNVLPAIGVNPLTDFPGGPFTGNFTLSVPGCQDRRQVEVCDLFVHSAGVDKLNSNTLTATIRGLGGGGHIVVVGGAKRPGSYPDPADARCVVDDIRDKGISEEIGVEILRPDQGDVISPPTTPAIAARACHGRQFGEFKVNGLAYAGPVSGQVLVPGDNENSADTYVMNLTTALQMNNLRAEYDGAAPQQGRLDPGMNRLIAQVSDLDQNSSFDNVFFAVGPLALNTTTVTSAAASGVTQEIMGVVADVASVQIDKAFTLAMDAGAMNTFFHQLCHEIGPDLATGLEERLNGYKSDKFTIPTPWPLCDVHNARMKVTAVDIDPMAFDCDVIPMNDKVQIKLTLPAFTASTHFGGGCEVDGPFGICVVEVIVNTDVDFQVPPITVTYELTETQILTNQLMSQTNFSLGGDPFTINGTLHDHSEVNCIVGAILDILDFILKVVTFGAWDPNLDNVQFELSSDKIKDKLGEKNGDMREVKEFKFDNEDLIPEYNSKLKAMLSDVQITPQGFAAAISASFDATVTDPEGADIPGTPLTPAPLPVVPIPNSDEVTVAISDDVFNQLLSSLTQSGKFKTLFEDVRVLGDFLPTPAQCAALGPVLEPRCVGLIGGDCTQYVLQSRREACENAKQKMQDRLLTPGTAVILHAHVDNPPKLLIIDNPATQDKVEVRLRFSQISVALLVDRDGDGHLSGSLASLPRCFGPSPTTNHECALWEACLNVNVDGQLFLPPGELLLRMQVLDVSHELSTGMVCNGGIDDADDESTIDEAAQGATLDKLNQKLHEGTPDLKTKGLDFGGLVHVENARLISIENDGHPEFQDYIAITGKLVVTSP